MYILSFYRIVVISQGGDNDCKCNDPTVPLSREEVKGWTKTHVVNKLQSQQNANWDVVLLGDEFVQDFTGRILNQPNADLKNVYKYWNATFTLDGGGGGESVDGVALGISGDSVCILQYANVISFLLSCLLTLFLLFSIF